MEFENMIEVIEDICISIYQKKKRFVEEMLGGKSAYGDNNMNMLMSEPSILLRDDK